MKSLVEGCSGSAFCHPLLVLVLVLVLVSGDSGVLGPGFTPHTQRHSRFYYSKGPGGIKERAVEQKKRGRKRGLAEVLVMREWHGVNGPGLVPGSKGDRQI